MAAADMKGPAMYGPRMKLKCACRTGDYAHVQAAEAQPSGSDSSPESTQQQLQTAGKLGSCLIA